MNVLELLSTEIKDKHWTVEEKVRYLYLRCCQLFTFDERYFLYSEFINGEKYQRFLRKKEINLEEVYDNRVVCTSFSKYVLLKVLQDLLTVDCYVKGNEHQFVIWRQENGNEMALDATIGDIHRIKMNCQTYGYRPHDTKMENFEEKLKEIDQNIHYINEEYEEARQKRIIDERAFFLEELPWEENLIEKMNLVKEFYQEYPVKDYYTAARYCLHDLQRQIFSSIDRRYMRECELFQDYYNAPRWDLASFYPLFLKTGAIYYVLKKENNQYCFEEMEKEEVKNYTKTMRGEAKQFLFRSRLI